MEKHNKSSRLARNRHREIIKKFDELVAREVALDSDRAKYISKQFYIDRISQDPVLGLSGNYISKIINNRFKYERN